jgi:hypothetical protein
MMDGFCVVVDHPSILQYVDGLQRKNAEALSFYPKQVFEREQKSGRIFLGLLNGEPCGYIYVGAGGADVKCHQVCIQYDLRRRLYGAMLAQALEDYATSYNAYSITLRCGFDLQANDFWKSLGYICAGVVNGGIRRNRKINIWRKQLQDELFVVGGVEPAEGKTDASLWRKGKETGVINQFARGRLLEEYRLRIVK